jgi:thiol-disulfide isomerase/thioredoxin
MKKYAALLLVCLLLAASIGCMQLRMEAPTDTPVPPAENAEPTTQPEGAAPAEVPEAGAYQGPQFSAESLTGETVDETYIQENRLTMLNFWATWCGPCVAEMPDLAELHKNYAEKGFSILGVMVDADTEAALSLIEEFEVGYPILPLSGDLVEMAGGFRYVPTTVFFDSSGAQVGEIQIGSMNYAEWSALVDELLEGVS